MTSGERRRRTDTEESRRQKSEGDRYPGIFWKWRQPSETFAGPVQKPQVEPEPESRAGNSSRYLLVNHQ